MIFGLAGQRLALPVEVVRECLPLPELWRRPGLPDSVAGFFSLGGVVVPVIDLAVLLGLQTVQAAAFEQGGLYRPLLLMGDVTLLVDRLEQVAVPDAAAPPTTVATPDVATGLAASDRWQHGCVARHLFAGGVPVALLDPSRILLADEQARLDILTRDAARRAQSWDMVSDEATAGGALAVEPDAG